MKKFYRVLGSYVLILLTIFIFTYIMNENKLNEEEAPYLYSDLVRDLTNDIPNDILKIEITSNPESANTAYVRVYRDITDLKKYKTVFVPSIESFNNLIDNDIKTNNDFIIVSTLKGTDKSGIFQMLTFVMFAGVSIIILSSILKKNGDNNKAMGFGKSKAKMIIDQKGNNNFSKVAGLEEEKTELQEVVEFLKSPAKFDKIGAKIPKGVLLVGEPGTGKTLLAKAVAGEASVPFFTISGSDFVEMFVGVGASRVRDLFATAKKNAPCIIFIDEIDAVGRKRGAGIGGGHDEREQTLNQLLVEMDGFEENTGIIILAATNRPDILDKALLRPGRFDRQVTIGMPDIRGREEILKIHAKNKKMSEDIDFTVISRTTAGFTGADLEALLNESAILTARKNEKKISMETVKEAFIKRGIGTEKKSRVIAEKDRIMTSYHEIGHAIMQEMLSELDPVHIVSIIPTGRAGGYTMHLPLVESNYMTKTYMKQTIISLLGGLGAEKLMLDEVTTGASNDIERATGIARAMVTKYGMSEKLGHIQFGLKDEEVFLGNQQQHTRNYSEEVASQIDEEVKNIIDECHRDMMKILKSNKNILEIGKEILLKEDKISGEQFRSLFQAGTLPEKEIPILMIPKIEKRKEETGAKKRKKNREERYRNRYKNKKTKKTKKTKKKNKQNKKNKRIIK